MASPQQKETNAAWEGMPWWVKATFFLGFPTIVAMASLYFNYWIIVGQLANHDKELVQHRTEVTPHVHETNASHLMQFSVINDLRYITMRICQHQSHNERERDECIPPPSKAGGP